MISSILPKTQSTGPYYPYAYYWKENIYISHHLGQNTREKWQSLWGDLIGALRGMIDKWSYKSFFNL